ncbi:MAG: diphthine--ammonia ligase [Candidatus ainarchaeum sp.]|nr:diphthine--ammonia ligase [Candidatus ainarchaeum sp.]
MCAIIGAINFYNNEEIVKNGLKIMKNRGKDYSKIIKYKKIVFGHNLHSTINYVEQPLVSSKGILISNCEIYNWKELSKKYSIRAKNDSELLLKLFDKTDLNKIHLIIEELDGDFAIAYYSKKKEKIILARDIVGVKPIVYFFDKKEKFCFASEKKALPFESIHLNPRKIIFYNTKTNSLKLKKRIIKKIIKKEQSIEIEKALFKSVTKRIPEKRFALLLSGGIDSALIGKIMQKNNLRFNSYFAGIKDFSEPKDLEFAKKVSYNLNSPIKINLVSIKKFEKELPKIIFLIESSDPIRVGIASTIYFATKKIKEKIVFSGLGADELFVGYNRFKESNNINKDCYSYLIKMYENDLYFEDIITMANKVELRVPFLDKELVSLSLSLEPRKKICPETGLNKKILREIAINLGLPIELAERPKKAAQYGSNFDKAIEFLSKKNSFKSKTDYLNNLKEKNFVKKSFLNKSKNNIPIGALFSTGKDSIYAMQLMKKQGYEIKCLITIESKNKDSFMFHTPTIKLARLQAKALGVPLIIIKTKGEKEKELVDLKKAIKKAIKEFGIEGVCSGALFSNYQRERIENICEALGIRAFAPLWHFNQKKYLDFLLKENFKIMITKIACYGLNEKWLGKIISKKDVLELSILEKKFGINIAGEGGEYETFVIDASFFRKKILIDFEKKLENDFTGFIKINKAKLVKK